VRKRREGVDEPIDEYEKEKAKTGEIKAKLIVLTKHSHDLKLNARKRRAKRQTRWKKKEKIRPNRKRCGTVEKNAKNIGYVSKKGVKCVRPASRTQKDEGRGCHEDRMGGGCIKGRRKKDRQSRYVDAIDELSIVGKTKQKASCKRTALRVCPNF